MKSKLLIGAVLFASLVFSAPAVSAQSKDKQQASEPGGDTQGMLQVLPGTKQTITGADAQTVRIAREVRHELAMLPYYSLFDDLKYKVDGSTVTLGGAAISLSLKSDAESAVKNIEGVTKVINNIEQLPPSPADDQIRHAEARQIFSFGNLSRYSWEASPTIHIIVKNGRVWLEGVVDSEADKNAAGLQANQVPGVFSVTNNLQIASNGRK